MDLGTAVNNIFKVLTATWDKEPMGGAVLTGMLIGATAIGLLVFIFLVQRGIEWTADWDYDEFCVKKKFCCGYDSFDRGVILCFSVLIACLSPTIILIIYKIWPIALVGSILLGFAHLTRFVLRLCKRFKLHEKDYTMHNGGDE